MTGIEVREARSPAELEQALAIRSAVFVAERGVAEALEIDGRDGTARHLLAIRDGEPVGILRLRCLEGSRTVEIERVAVLAAARGQKVGQALMRAALDRPETDGADEAGLHAQTRRSITDSGSPPADRNPSRTAYPTARCGAR